MLVPNISGNWKLSQAIWLTNGVISGEVIIVIVTELESPVQGAIAVTE